MVQGNMKNTILKSFSNPEVEGDVKQPLAIIEAPVTWVDRAVGVLGKSKEDLSRPWVRYLCAINGLLHTRVIFGEFQDKMLYKTKEGTKKVASFAVMNSKYIGIFRLALFLHIASGVTAHLGSALAIVLEEWKPRMSKRLATIASIAELFVHAPSALVMSPIVYGDKGITPPVYTVVSLALGLSAAASLAESTSEVPPLNKGIRPELRRMCTTIGIFLYVRMYALIRGPQNFLEPQKYALATVMAGFTMGPVGWSGGMFPATFWMLFLYNIKTVGLTGRMVRRHGVDGAAKQMAAMTGL